MNFVPHHISSPLSDHIESIFHFSDFMPEHSIERVVPTGHLFILFELDDIKRYVYDNTSLEPLQSFTKVWVSGMHRNYLSISAHQQSEMFVIQFKPFGAFPFFHQSIEGLTDKVLPGEMLLGEAVLQLRQQLYNAQGSNDKFQLAETWLMDRFDNSKLVPKELHDVQTSLQDQPVTEYSKAIEAYPKTQKHLIGQFKKYMGLTPKYYQRILRFNEILQELQNNKSVAWSQIAYQCGYADQSHFIKEFKHFSGFNPSEFIRDEHNLEPPNFFPLDRKG